MATAIVGLIGDPVAHSISPLFQQAAFDALGINARYERWQTASSDLAARIVALRADPFLGANVTTPHKEAAARLLDELDGDVDPLARRAGAINTIYRRDASLCGANTDILGFERALREAGGFTIAGARTLVLGAGGAARAVVLALERAHALSVIVTNRTFPRAQRLTAELHAATGPLLSALSWDEALTAHRLGSIDLLVNCTTMGLSGSPAAQQTPVTAALLSDRLFVCDIVANPVETPLLREAKQAGARTLGGLSMLVYQGAAAFSLWTKRDAPVALMLRAAQRAMQPAG